jgi:hypothetical protein
LYQPAYRNLPVALLIYLWTPRAEHYLPATREAAIIARHLPLPAAEQPAPAREVAEGLAREGD